MFGEIILTFLHVATCMYTLLTFRCRDRELLARYMRHITTVIYNAKVDLKNSPDALYTALTQIIEKPHTETNDDRNKPPEMQMVEVCLFYLISKLFVFILPYF